MNQIIISGRLTRDPEVKFAQQTERSVCTFSIAVDDGYGDNKRTDFFNIVVFGKQADSCERYISKGSKVIIQGSARNDYYEKDGIKHYQTQVVAKRVEFLDSKKDAPSNDAPASGFRSVDEDIPW